MGRQPRRQPPYLPVYPIATIRELLFEAAGRYRDQIALQSKKDGVYRPLTYTELKEQVTKLAIAFFLLGLEKPDRVAVLSENRTEWALTYLAAVTAGLTAVPVDRELKAKEIQHILHYTGARILVCSKPYLDQVSDQRPSLPSLQSMVSMEEEKSGADLVFSELIAKGEEALSNGDRRFEDTLVSEADLAALIFTSGTTGNSKAVMLTHGNIASNVVATSSLVALNRSNDVVLSVLPLHHTYECTGGFLTALYQGCTVCHAENLRRVPENLRETGATVMLGVPLLFESIYGRIKSGIEEKGSGRFRFAKFLAAVSEKLLGINVRRKLFRQVHDKLGGQLRLLISGGAAIRPTVARGLRELGFDFLQGYGMTEAAPIITINRVNYFKDEAAGVPVPGVEVRIVDGEVTVRGPNVMKGYYRNEKATGETLINGWLYTGDLGYFDKEGFLHISGRKKSVIVTGKGKNVYPEEIEGVLNQSPYVLESLVWGEQEENSSQVEIQAIIVPRNETFDQEFGPQSVDQSGMEKIIGAEVKRCCSGLAGYKRIKKFTLRMEEFEKTTTRKIKRYLYTAKPKAQS